MATARKNDNSTTAVAIGAAALIGAGIFLFGRKAFADEPGPAPGPTPGPAPEPPRPGPGPRPDIPKPAGGGKTYGIPPASAGYQIPADWDPLRGLWISPDCEVVVEAPGWYCGVGGPQGLTPQAWGDFSCRGILAESYVETMAVERNGVTGYVEFLIETGLQPEQIAFQIVQEIAPMCADAPMWPAGLLAWWDDFLRRVVEQWEEFHGIPFEP